MLTTTPEVIYLFMALTTAAPGKPAYVELYETTDKVACETQATEWTTKMAPSKFVCVSHSQKKLIDALKQP